MAELSLKDERIQLSALEDLYKQKRLPEALSAAVKLKEEFPRSFHVRFLYAKILKELDRLTEAEETLNELMQLFPNNINVLLETGKLAVESNRFDDAIDYYNKILFLDPFSPDAKSAIDRINLLKKEPLRKEKMAYSEPEPIHDQLPMEDFRDLKRIAREDTRREEFFMEPPPPIPPEALHFEEPEPQPFTIELEGLKPEINNEPEPVAPPLPDDNKNLEFVTESAAELYMKQGLFEDALDIYRKLFLTQNIPHFKDRVHVLEKAVIEKRKVKALYRLLKSINQKYKGEHLV
ncbi:MAG: tetratricopeptide repeat protein [Candidatus Omnitrophota bacterium]